MNYEKMGENITSIRKVMDNFAINRIRCYLQVATLRSSFVFVVVITFCYKYYVGWCERKLRRFDYFIVCAGEEDPVVVL